MNELKKALEAEGIILEEIKKETTTGIKKMYTFRYTGQKVAPAINEKNFEDLLALDTDTAVEKIKNAIKKSKSIDLEAVKDLDNIFACVEKKSGLPKNAMWVDLPGTDMAITIRSFINEEMTALVSQEAINYFNIDIHEAISKGVNNTINSGYVLKSLDDLFGLPKGTSPIWILMANIDTFGASVLINHDALDFAYKTIGKFYIIPSSREEILLLPADHFYSDMGNIVREVNPIVDENIRLSEHVYLYNNGKFEEA